MRQGLGHVLINRFMLQVDDGVILAPKEAERKKEKPSQKEQSTNKNFQNSAKVGSFLPHKSSKGEQLCSN